MKFKEIYYSKGNICPRDKRMTSCSTDDEYTIWGLYIYKKRGYQFILEDKVLYENLDYWIKKGAVDFKREYEL